MASRDEQPDPPCPTPFTRRLLEGTYRRPKDGLLKIRPKCHPDSGMTVEYCFDDGCAVLTCAKCGHGVARIQMAFAGDGN